MTDFQDDLERRSALQDALEARFGPAGSWPLKIQAACAQLTTMQQLMGDDYATYIQCARQAVDEHRARAGIRTTLDRRQRLGLLLTPTGNHHDRHDTLDVGWAMNYGLEVLLSDEQYEHLIDAAHEAAELEPSTAGTL